MHRHLDSLAQMVHSSDPEAIHELSQEVFLHEGMPANVAYASNYVQRLAQAETDYRNGSHTPLHVADIVRANNDFARILGAPQWALTDQLEVSRLRMELLARYPQLFANPRPVKVQGHFQIFAENLSPMEAVFLATSLLYQKEFNPKYQLTLAERGNSTNNQPFPPSLFQARTQDFTQLLHGSAPSQSLSSLARAGEILLADLNISPSLRPEFESLQFVAPTAIGKGGRE